MIHGNHRLSLQCLSKEEKREKHQSCSYQAEAKNDYRVERCMAGQRHILHGQISFVTILRAAMSQR